MPDTSEPPVGLLPFYEASLGFGRKTQADHSKWLINTLYLLHSGAIAGLLSRLPTERIPQFVGSLNWFVIGLAFAFLAGLATWSNYEFYICAYSELIKRIRRGQWRPGDELPKSAKFVSVTVVIALAFGLLACTRFRRHRVRCFNGTGGGSWRGGDLRASSSLRL